MCPPVIAHFHCFRLQMLRPPSNLEEEIESAVVLDSLEGELTSLQEQEIKVGQSFGLSLPFYLGYFYNSFSILRVSILGFSIFLLLSILSSF
jgi:hypothetical protein